MKPTDIEILMLADSFELTDPDSDIVEFARALLAKYGNEPQAAPEGQEISVDVSTGEHDAGHRIFAQLTGEDNGGVWLAEMTEDNAPQVAQGDELPPFPKLTRLSSSYGFTYELMRDYARAALSRQPSAGDMKNALEVIAGYPVSDESNMDTMNMRSIARSALATKRGK